MKRDASGAGVVHLARDGVLRTLNAERSEVLDYIQLTPRQIADFTSGRPLYIRDALAGIDGRDVTSVEELVAVPADVVPRDLAVRGQSLRERSLLLEKRASCDDYACDEDDDCLEFNCEFCAIMLNPDSSNRCA